MPTMNKTKPDEESPPLPMHGEIQEDPAYAHDAVFGEITEDGPNFRDVRCPCRGAPVADPS